MGVMSEATPGEIRAVIVLVYSHFRPFTAATMPLSSLLKSTTFCSSSPNAGWPRPLPGQGDDFFKQLITFQTKSLPFFA